MCASSQNSRRYGPGSLFGPGYVEPSLCAFARSDPDSPHQSSSKDMPRGSCATYSCLGAIPDHLDFALRISRPGTVLDPRGWGQVLLPRGNAASHGICGILRILWETCENYTTLWDPKTAPDRARTNIQKLGKAVQAMPRHRRSRGRQNQDKLLIATLHLGVSAHEMAAHRLECVVASDATLRGSAGSGTECLHELLSAIIGMWTRISKSSPSLGAESFYTNRHRYSGFQHDAPALDSVFGMSSILRHTLSGAQWSHGFEDHFAAQYAGILAAVAPHPWPCGSMLSNCHRATRVNRPNRGDVRSLRTGPGFSILQIDGPSPSAPLLSP